MIHLLFGVVSGSLQPFLGCYALFQVAPLFTTNGVTECFDLQSYYKSISCRFYYTVRWTSINVLQSRASVITKWGRFFCITKSGKWYYKVGQFLLKSGAVITKWGKFYYKVGQYRRQMRETGEGYIFWQKTS